MSEQKTPASSVVVTPTKETERPLPKGIETSAWYYLIKVYRKAPP